jgi:hypothetical protein
MFQKLRQALTKQIVGCDFSYFNLQDLEAGIHWFGTIYRSPQSRTKLQQALLVYDNLRKGTGTSLLNFQVLHETEKFGIPYSMTEVTDCFKSLRVLLHASSFCLSSFCAGCKSIFPLGLQTSTVSLCKSLCPTSLYSSPISCTKKCGSPHSPLARYQAIVPKLATQHLLQTKHHPLIEGPCTASSCAVTILIGNELFPLPSPACWALAMELHQILKPIANHITMVQQLQLARQLMCLKVIAATRGLQIDCDTFTAMTSIREIINRLDVHLKRNLHAFCHLCTQMCA